MLLQRNTVLVIFLFLWMYHLGKQYIIRSSCPEVFYENVVLKNFAKFTGEYLHQSLFLIRLACMFWHRCFPMNFAKFLRILLFTEDLLVTTFVLWHMCHKIHHIKSYSYQTTSLILMNKMPRFISSECSFRPQMLHFLVALLIIVVIMRKYCSILKIQFCHLHWKSRIISNIDIWLSDKTCLSAKMIFFSLILCDIFVFACLIRGQ